MIIAIYSPNYAAGKQYWQGGIPNSPLSRYTVVGHLPFKFVSVRAREFFGGGGGSKNYRYLGCPIFAFIFICKINFFAKFWLICFVLYFLLPIF